VAWGHKHQSGGQLRSVDGVVAQGDAEVEAAAVLRVYRDARACLPRVASAAAVGRNRSPAGPARHWRMESSRDCAVNLTPATRRARRRHLGRCGSMGRKSAVFGRRCLLPPRGSPTRAAGAQAARREADSRVHERARTRCEVPAGASGSVHRSTGARPGGGERWQDPSVAESPKEARVNGAEVRQRGMQYRPSREHVVHVVLVAPRNTAGKTQKLTSRLYQNKMYNVLSGRTMNCNPMCRTSPAPCARASFNDSGTDGSRHRSPPVAPVLPRPKNSGNHRS